MSLNITNMLGLDTLSTTESNRNPGLAGLSGGDISEELPECSHRSRQVQKDSFQTATGWSRIRVIGRIP